MEPTTPERSAPSRAPNRTVLLTGATGYIGGRLLARLEAAGRDGGGRPLRCMARKPAFLRPRVDPETDVVQGDVLRPETLPAALEGIDVAFYLVHSMGDSGAFREKEAAAARNFAAAARDAGVRRIVYLGGLGRGDDLSPHLESRQEVGRILRDSGVPTIEFRSSIIIGSGSLSFELIRALVDKLPVMITPRWVRTPTQPIAVEDVLAYLEAAIEHPGDESAVYEIAGPDRMSYGDLMLEYARQRGMRRLMLPVPFLSLRLSSLWLGLVTPVYARIGRKLLTSMRNPTVVEDRRALAAFPIEPRGMEEAIARALVNEDREIAETRWSDALSSGRGVKSWAGVRFRSRLVDSRTRRVRVTPERAFRPIERIGGARGWYFAGWLWRIRGFLDLLVGGVGMRRGRRDPDRLAPGDQLDFWRVEAIERPHLLRLFAEMRLPGRAWLTFEVDEAPEDGEGAVIRQTAVFDPVGLFGLLYWYGIYPLHALVFAGMLRNIARRAESDDART